MSLGQLGRYEVTCTCTSHLFGTATTLTISVVQPLNVTLLLVSIGIQCTVVRFFTYYHAHNCTSTTCAFFWQQSIMWQMNIYELSHNFRGNVQQISLSYLRSSYMNSIIIYIIILVDLNMCIEDLEKLFNQKKMAVYCPNIQEYTKKFCWVQWSNTKRIRPISPHLCRGHSLAWGSHLIHNVP